MTASADHPLRQYFLPPLVEGDSPITMEQARAMSDIEMFRAIRRESTRIAVDKGNVGLSLLLHAVAERLEQKMETGE